MYYRIEPFGKSFIAILFKNPFVYLGVLSRDGTGLWNNKAMTALHCEFPNKDEAIISAEKYIHENEG